MTRPKSPALKADLETAEQAAEAMHERYAGKLAVLLDGGAGGARWRRPCASSRR